MSTVITSTSAEHLQLRTATPSFLGILRGELFKISRQWTTWIMSVLLLGVIVLPYIVLGTAPNIKEQLRLTPLHFFYNETQIGFSVLRVFCGIFLLILTAYVIGSEYQLGTIRILLARGVGRLQLLAAKLLAIVTVALILFVVGVLLNAALLCLLVAALAGNLNAFSTLTADFWSNTWLYALTVLISMGVTILMATAVTVIARSLSFGLSAALGWFPVDNIGLIFLMLGFRITQNDVWRNVSAYVLGPNLNVMPAVLLPASIRPNSIGITPLVEVSGVHTLWVALIYALIFAVVAVALTWRRDVKE
ncbi:MAG: ABC transporter permease [Chloroflexi bacterium]|nr:ABC transporter permease [Chloroflexota bacterium]